MLCQKHKPTNLKRFYKYSDGFALIAVLWLLVLLSLISMQLSIITRSEAQLAKNMAQGAKARYAAESGVHWAIWSLTLPKQDLWLADGSFHLMEIDGSEVTVSLQDENGKIDLNVVTPEQLGKLLQVVGVDEPTNLLLTDAILDWRDEDSLKRLNGAEDEDYLAGGYQYGAKDDYFSSVYELKKVIGMTDEIFNSIKPALTVHSRKNGINPLVAPRLVLLSLEGADESLVDQYIDDRRQNHEVGLPPPEAPGFHGKLISPNLQGVYYTIHTEALVGQDAKSFKQVVIRRRSTAANTRIELIRSSNLREPLLEGLESDY